MFSFLENNHSDYGGIDKMNKAQKMIKAIIYPIIIIVVTIGVAGDLCKWFFGGSLKVHAFDFEETWPFWVIALVIIYMIEKNIFESWTNLIRESYEYSTKGEYLKSIKIAQKALKLNPRASEAWRLIGNAYEFLSDEMEEAAKTQVFNKKQKCEQATEYHKKATEAWDKAKNINPEIIIPDHHK